MNIVQLHERTKFWLDRVASPRFDFSAIDNALNDGIKEIIEEKYDGSRQNHKGDSFQRTQRVRDELWSIVTMNNTDTNLVLTGSLVTKASIDALTKKYRYLLAAAAKFTSDAAEYTLPLYPLTYDRKYMSSRNPYRRPKLGANARAYYIESDLGIDITGPEGIDPDSVTIHYLREPVTVAFGIETIGPFPDQEVIIVSSLTAVYDGVTYQIGDTVTIDFPKGLSLTSGLGVYQYTGCDLPDPLHGEIAVKAAIGLLITAEMNEKAKILNEKIMAA